MKKLLLSINMVILGLALLLSGCVSEKGNNSSDSGSSKKIKIGIAQIAEHPSLDAARQGFLDVLAANGYKEGENLEVNYQNAQGDMPTLNTIATNFVSEKAELILAIATPSAQAVASSTKDNQIPVLFTAVTDPVAAGLVESMEKPNTNLTGTTDMAPIADQLKLLKELKPEVKNIGVIYNASEVNSVVQVELVKAAAKDLGLSIVEAAATNSSEVDLAARSLVGKAEAIYIPADNTVVSAVEAVINVAEKQKMPVVSAEKDSVKRGTVATIGLDYYKLGQQTGEMAVKILKGQSKPQDMPVESQEEKDIIINVTAAKAMGITIPQSILDKAKEVLE